MVKIRLTRIGRKKAPFYRIIVADSRRARDGKFIEIIGRYQPLQKEEEKQLTCVEDRAVYWLLQGAQPTDTVRSLLGRCGVMQRFQDEKAAQKNQQPSTDDSK